MRMEIEMTGLLAGVTTEELYDNLRLVWVAFIVFFIWQLLDLLWLKSHHREIEELKDEIEELRARRQAIEFGHEVHTKLEEWTRDDGEARDDGGRGVSPEAQAEIDAFNRDYGNWVNGAGAGDSQEDVRWRDRDTRGSGDW